jgi:hypothetical protein
LHRTCPLSGVKQTSMADKSIHGQAARVRCANADRCGGGSPSHRSAAVRVSAATRRSRSWMSFKTSSGDTLDGTLVKDGRCLVPRGDMAGKSNESAWRGVSRSRGHLGQCRIAKVPDFIGDPGWIRTSDPQLRRLMLYPAELRGRRNGFSRRDTPCKDAAQGCARKISGRRQRPS